MITIHYQRKGDGLRYGYRTGTRERIRSYLGSAPTVPYLVAYVQGQFPEMVIRCRQVKEVVKENLPLPGEVEQ